jgi:hypothetical protein
MTEYFTYFLGFFAGLWLCFSLANLIDYAFDWGWFPIQYRIMLPVVGVISAAMAGVASVFS